MSSMALYGKVIRIFDETTLLVNIGSKDGMKRGDNVFVVEAGEEITDPDTGESLGDLEMVKAELTAVDIQERMSVLKTISVEAHEANLPLSARMARDSVRREGERQKMAVVHGEMSGVPSPAPVRIGDTVRRVE